LDFVNVRITPGDLILLGLRDYQDGKADVILKYTADEARMLKSYKEIPENVKVNEQDAEPGEEDEGIACFFNV
jgi:translation initiation factor 1A